MNVKFVNFKWGFTGELQEMKVTNDRVTSRIPSPQASRIGQDDVIDLQGKYLLPGFVDAHCHILPTGLDLGRLHLGIATTKEEVLQLVREEHAKRPEGWLHAVHYNQTKFPDGVHLVRSELDKISIDRPILLRHVNGHASVANSSALAAAKVDETTADPPGGTYRRDQSGRLDGVLLERAHEYVTACSPIPSVELMADAIVAAGVKMSELGISCASDMMTGCIDLELELQAYALAAKNGCPIHIRLYLQWGQVFGRRAMTKGRLAELVGELEAQPSLRVDGVKIFADGGISSATAAIYGRYLTSAALPDESRSTITDGQLIYKPDKLKQMVRTADTAGYKVSIHSIGDYSTDLVLDAFAETGDPSRHRIEHAMMLSDAQIERMRSLGCLCTFQPEFLLRLAGAYRSQLGAERMAKLFRSRSVIDAGIPLSFNSDRPIVAGDPWDGIRTASQRPPGFDPGENCSREEAMLAYTVEGARANGDLTEMGTLLPGTFADFQLYDSDPMTEKTPSVLPKKYFLKTLGTIKA